MITTLAHESRAVGAHLVDVERIVGTNGAIYEMGRFSEPSGDWHIVHLITQAGNSDASALATQAHSEFGKFDVQIFVGVAGSLKEDVPIGTVVVGQCVYNSHSSKVDDSGYYSRPHSHTAALELLQAAQMLVIDGDWVPFIKDPTATKLPPTDAYPCPYPPQAVLKSIASGEQVVAGSNTPSYQLIRQYLNDAAAVEMEGYGAMSAAHLQGTSAIVIRGISDMCDGKNHVSDAHYQPIAAAHAAAFAFSLLSVRSKASPLSPSGKGIPSFPPGLEDEMPAKPRIDCVLNFRGSLADFSEAKVEEIVEQLKRITGDPDLSLVRIDEGSVRLVVNIREADVPTLTLEAAKEAAGEAAPQLLGVATSHELAEAEKAKAALKAASAGLLSWGQCLPGGVWLERPEQYDVEARFDSNCSSTVVLGEPGSGKSALLAAISTRLVEAGAPVLAIKADLVSPTVRNEHDLKSDLGLHTLPSQLIERAARIQPVFLLIDQLDALASQLDLHTDRLNVLLNLVRRVAGRSNVHIVLSARSFEFNHDVRLKTIDAEPITLGLPAWHDVEAQLVAAGINANTWPENAREVIRNPQALKTYLSLVGVNNDPPFSRYQSMLEHLWRQQVIAAPDGQELALLASDLAGTMAEDETLWIAASRFDTQSRALERLVSIGLIIRSDTGKSVAFSHQTVFDYVLARSFVRTTGRLSSYVLQRQNSLFVRSKLWSALRYLRDSEPTSYEREFLDIWRQRDLRRHLRLLLVEFLGELREPVAFEIDCLTEIMHSPDFRAAGLKSISGSPGWFAAFKHSAIPGAMQGSVIEAHWALRILQKAWPVELDEVVRLLREVWLPAPSRDALTWSAIDACVSWTDEIERMALTILARTPISSWQVDYTASVMAVQQPNVAFRLVRGKLDFLLEQARATPPGSPFPFKGTSDDMLMWHIKDDPVKPFDSIVEAMEWSSVPAMAEAHPIAFLENLWPWFKAVLGEMLARGNQARTEYSFAGRFPFDFDFEGSTARASPREYPLISSLAIAVECAAKLDPSYFLGWAEANGNVQHIAAQRLIAYGFRSAPSTFAQRALEWLFDDPRRLQLGTLDGPRKTTAALVQGVSPHWTSEQIGSFESRILKYRPPTPKHLTEPIQRRYFYQSIRTTKVRLLSAIPLDKLSEASRKLIATEKRALGEDLDRGVTHFDGGFVGSPMSAESMAKAQDRDILKLFEEIPDGTDWDHPKNWMRGGNIQLSRAFAEFSKNDPTRALRILQEFTPGAQERAAGYALESIAELEGRERDIQDRLLDLHDRGFDGDEFRASAAQAVQKIANRGTHVGPRVVELLVEWLATPTKHAEGSGGDSESKEITHDEGPKAQIGVPDSILWGHGGIHVLPGGNFPILSALTAALLKDSEGGRDQLFAILNSHLTRERDEKVWQALLIHLSHAGGSTPDVVSKFLRALFEKYPTLLEARETAYFLAYAQRWDDSLVFEVIANWDQSNSPTMRQTLGELVGLISILRESNRWAAMRNRLLRNGSSEAKVGLAFAGANLWTNEKLHSSAGALLEGLIPGADRGRMSAILDVFRISSDLIPEPTTLSFLQALSAPQVDLSSAPDVFIVEKLQSLLPHAADIVGSIALKLVEGWRSDLGNVGTARSMAAPELTDLAITLHRLGGSNRDVGVALFETLIDMDAYGARDTLAEIDGRFGLTQTSVRRRIARISSNRKIRKTI